MLTSLAQIFDTTDFPPRWQCGEWSDLHGWVHIVSDTAIFLAYFAIPTSIAIFVRKRPDVQFPKLAWLFAFFILSCGIGHLIEASLFWQPWYRFSAVSKAITAIISWLTVIALWKLLPAAVNLPGIAKLNDELRREIVERRQAESELRTREAEFRVMAESLPQVVFATDPQGKNHFVNSYFVEFTGISEEQAAGDGWREALHPEDRVRAAEHWQRSVATEEPWEIEYRLCDKHGLAHTFLGRATPVRDSNGQVVRWIGFSTDISERKLAEQRRLELDRKIQETQKLESLGILAGGIAHDFNNLLAGILGNASLARMQLARESSVQELVESIETSAIRASDLCKQMLAYSGRGKLVVQKINLSQVVEETTYLLKSSISKKAVLKFSLEESVLCTEADVTQIRQVIMNLVINASEAIGDRSGFIHISTGMLRADRDYLDKTLGQAGLPEGDYVFLEVADTGTGMVPKVQTRIFDPFYTTKFTGRGLGLAAVLGIVKAHNGSIKVYSEPDKGTTIKMLLPASFGPVEEQVRHLAADSSWRGSGRVLVVDDEETVRSVCARALEAVGFEVELAEDGRQAVEIFKKNKDEFRFILMDLTMPHLDGEQAFRALRSIDPKVIVVLMSGFAKGEAMDRFVGKGLAGFIEKPFRAESLIEYVRTVLSEGS